MSKGDTTIYHHPKTIKGEGFSHQNGTLGFKIETDALSLVVFNGEELGAADLVAALLDAANELGVLIQEEASE